MFSLLKTLSVIENMTLMIGWLVNNELERTWKEAIMTEFTVIFTHMSGGTIGKHENFSLYRESPADI